MISQNVTHLSGDPPAEDQAWPALVREISMKKYLKSVNSFVVNRGSIVPLGTKQFRQLLVYFQKAR